MKKHSSSSLFFKGSLMGIAELIPGVSAGTIAFLTGIYQPLLRSLKTFDRHSIALLFSGKFKQWMSHVAWDFFLPLLFGMGLSLLISTKVFHTFLVTPSLRPLLLSVFFGLILASFFFCLRRVKRWKFSRYFLCIAGVCIAFALTGQSFMKEGAFTKRTVQVEQLESAEVAKKLQKNTSSWEFYLRVYASGALAITAMLLPGISGSYLLHLLGLYSLLVSSLALTLEGLRHFTLAWTSLAFLGALSLGILTGLVFFSRAVSWLFRTFEDAMITFFAGFMLGACPSIWPFWSYVESPNPLDPTKEVLLEPLYPFFPEWNDPILWGCVALAAMGAVALFFVGKLSHKKTLVSDFG